MNVYIVTRKGRKTSRGSRGVDIQDTIKADRVEIGEGGSLLFFIDDVLVKAYGDGRWLECEEA